MSNNPCCTCFGTQTTINACSNPSPKIGCGGCLQLGTIIKTDCDMNLCSNVGTLDVDFSCFCFPCSDPTFKITNTAELTNIEVVSIDKNKLVVQSTGDGFVSSQTVKFKAVCQGTGDDSCTTYSDIGKVTIYFKGVCAGVLCDDGEVCNKCTGVCEPGETNITVSRGSGSTPTNITIS